MSEPIIELREVTKDYGTTVVTRVLYGVTLALRRGDFAALVGASGSGKSTLLNILGLLDAPSGGEVLVEGRPLAGLDDRERTRIRARTLGFVFQFHHLIPALSVAENVALPLALEAGRMTGSALVRARELLAMVGLEGRARARASELSGGQQQRVAIARALVHAPGLVLADEPTGNLDSSAAAEIFSLMRRLHRERGTAFLLVTHDQGIAERCDGRIVLADGRIVRDDRGPGEPAGPGTTGHA